MVLQILTLLGAFGLFLYGMKMLSASLQKFYGEHLRRFLPMMASPNKLRQIGGGFLFTVAVLFSTVTMMIVVSSVDAGMLSLAQAAGVIMGANIGTTVTAWLITFLGFTLDLKIFCFIVILVGFVLTMVKKPKAKLLGNVVIGFGLVFLSLNYMQSSMLALNEDHGILTGLTALTGHGVWTILLYIIIGAAVAFLLQSSGVTVALTLVLFSMGWLPFRLCAAIVIGANVGTTLTSSLAASKGNIQARRAANIRLIFNCFGAVLFFFLFKPLTYFSGWLVSLFGVPNPATAEFVAGTPQSDGALYAICIFHTLFNLVSALILVWFSEPLVRQLEKRILASAEEKGNIKFINDALVSTPAIAIYQVLREVGNFMDTCREGFGYVGKSLGESDDEIFEACRRKLVECEETTDKMEHSIAQFLNKLTTKNLSDDEASEVKLLYKMIGEMESIGDSCENISRVLERERVHNQKFDKTSLDNLQTMIDSVDNAFEVTSLNIAKAMDGTLTGIQNAYDAEDNVNQTRDRLRNEALENIASQKSGYQSANYYLDMLAELETIGDFLINISQALLQGVSIPSPFANQTANV